MILYVIVIVNKTGRVTGGYLMERMLTPIQGTQIAGADLVAKLLASKRSENTRRAYEKDLTDFFLTMAGRDPSPELVAHFLSLSRMQAVSLVVDYKAKLLARGLTEATVNRRLSALRALVNFAYSVGASEWRLDGQAIGNERVKAYRDTTGVNTQQMQKVMDIPDRGTLKGKRDYAILRLLWDNGLRRSEVVKCNVEDFDPEGRCLWILGKGKGTQKERVDLSEKTAAAIIDYLEARGNPDEGPLFTNVDRAGKGNGRLTSQAVYVLVRDLCKQAGISKPMSPHRIRHSAITEALELTNGNVRLVQKFSRHAKLETLQVYDDNRHRGQAQVTNLLAAVI